MEQIELRQDIGFGRVEELPQADQELVRMSIAATDNAYAKYSEFRVGAALRLKDGTTLIGANQENASYPAGLCAERAAIFAAQSQYPDQPIVTIAIAARNVKGLLAKPVTPCGICRQVMLEIEQRYQTPIRILLYGTQGVYVINGVETLLPLSFIGEDLK
jgi:cytidine deaminase